MKELTKEEYIDRLRALSQARIIFQSMKIQTCPHCGKDHDIHININDIFQAYQALFAENQRRVLLHKQQMAHLFPKIMDHINRPKCPKCGQAMLLMPYLDQLSKRQNTKGWKTCWFCPDNIDEEAPCFYEEYSTKTLQEWFRELNRKSKKKRKINPNRRGTGQCR